MDLQDLQDDRRSDLRYGEITEKMLGCAFEVTNELGNRGRPTDQLWESETRNQTIHTRQVNLSANGNHPDHLVHPCPFIMF